MSESVDHAPVATPGERYEARRERHRRSDRISGLVIALALLAALALAGKQIWTIATGPLPPGPGVAAPAIAGVTPDGKRIETTDLEGKVLLVDFWATWCPPCRAAMPGLQAVHRDFADRGLVVLGANQEPGQEVRVKRYLEGAGVTFESIMDDGDVARRWGVYTFPTSFIVGRDGIITQTYRGPAPEARLRRDLEAALGAKAN